MISLYLLSVMAQPEQWKAKEQFVQTLFSMLREKTPPTQQRVVDIAKLALRECRVSRALCCFVVV